MQIRGACVGPQLIAAFFIPSLAILSLKDMGADTLICTLHGDALRMVCLRSDRHYMGLSQAARSLGLPGRLRKRLQRLDDAFAVVRHITAPLAAGLLEDIEKFFEDGSDWQDKALRKGHDLTKLGKEDLEGKHSREPEVRCADDDDELDLGADLQPKGKTKTDVPLDKNPAEQDSDSLELHLNKEKSDFGRGGSTRK